MFTAVTPTAGSPAPSSNNGTQASTPELQTTPNGATPIAATPTTVATPISGMGGPGVAPPPGAIMAYQQALLQLHQQQQPYVPVTCKHRYSVDLLTFSPMKFFSANFETNQHLTPKTV